MIMQTSYRVQYTEVKPGGSHARQDESMRGDRSDVVRFLASRSIVPGSVAVTEYTASDSLGTDLGGLGW